MRRLIAVIAFVMVAGCAGTDSPEPEYVSPDQIQSGDAEVVTTAKFDLRACAELQCRKEWERAKPEHREDSPDYCAEKTWEGYSAETLLMECAAHYAHGDDREVGKRCFDRLHDECGVYAETDS